MKLAILSDIHDHVWNLRAALAVCKDADAMICCGDLCSPFVVHLLAKGFRRPIHIVFGNNDGDLYRITQNAARYRKRIHLHGEFADLSQEEFGLRIAVTHYPAIARAIAESREYDLVCYGHDHRLHTEIRPDGTSLINPGTVMGYDPVAGKDVASTVVLFDTRTISGYVIGAGKVNSLSMWPFGNPLPEYEAT